jgi:LAGLIDADG endonuclease
VSDGKFACYNVRDKDDIMKIIIPHFEKYPLITKKQSDFLLFKSILEIMNKNEHLSLDGLTKIIGLKVCLNRGISEKLIKHFPNITKVRIPK